MTIRNKGPWRQLNTKTVYDNPWISVRHEEVKTPNNTDGIYGCIHFKNIAIAVLPVDSDGCTRLVKQYRYVLEVDTLEIPEGGCPVGESPLEAAKRELREETGLAAGKWTEFLRVHISNSVSDEEGYIYLAEDLIEGEMDLEDTEDIVVEKIPLTEAFAMAADGRITDLLSVTALLKLQVLMSENN